MEQAGTGELETIVLERARRGDARAFAQIVERYQAPVYHLVYRMLGTAVEAEDGAQETFLRAYSQIRSYDPRQRFTPWILSIATHYCIDKLRRKKFVWLSTEDEIVQETLPSSGPGPEEQALLHERSAEVQHLLKVLPPAHRAVVALKYWNDLSVEEIARVTGESVSNIKVQLFRARQTLAKELQRQSRTTGQRRLEWKGANYDAR